jgi:hypothetical protein
LTPIWQPDGNEAPPRAELGHLARQAIQLALARRN